MNSTHQTKKAHFFQTKDKEEYFSNIKQPLLLYKQAVAFCKNFFAFLTKIKMSWEGEGSVYKKKFEQQFSKSDIKKCFGYSLAYCGYLGSGLLLFIVHSFSN